MTYSLQAFSSEQVLNAAQLNQIEINIKDHVHGDDSVSDHYSDSFYADVNQTLVSGSLHIMYGLASSRLSGPFSVVNSSELSVDNAGWYTVFSKVSMTITDSGFTPNFECYKNADASPSFRSRRAIEEGSGTINKTNFGTVYLDGGADYLVFKMSGQSSGSVIDHSITNTFIEIMRLY